MGNGYLWLKAVHVLAIISWMVGLLYLPRLFVYHVEAGSGSAQAATFQVMERRLMKGIMLPAIVVVWVTGIWLMIQGGWVKAGWLHWKILLVLALSGLHGSSLGGAQEARRRHLAPQFARLAHPQRGTDAAADRHRHPGDRQAVLARESSSGHEKGRRAMPRRPLG